MNHQHNEMLALEWLIEPLNEQIDALYARQQDDALGALAQIATKYKEIHGVLMMANLPDFFELAALIALMANHVSHTSQSEARLFLPVVLHASKLLQHELNHYRKSRFIRKNLLELRCQYLGMLLKELDIRTDKASPWQMAQGHRFSDQIHVEQLAPYQLSEDEYQQVSDTWYTVSEKLAKSTQDRVLHLGNLMSIATRMAGHISDELIKKLWTVAVLWIDSLILNEELHADDVYLLGKLNRAFGLESQDVSMANMLWLENVLIDIYVSLMSLSLVSRAGRDMLSRVDNNILTEQTFFSFITLTLKEIIKSLDDDVIRFDQLALIKDRLAVRGWSFYANSLTQIIAYAEDANSSGTMSFETAKNNIKAKLQTLYDAIKKTDEVAQTADDHHHGGVLNEVYIATEEIKNSFSEYLESKDVGDLPDSDGLYQLTHYFVGMQMNEVVVVSEKLTTLFLTLKDKAPNRISWQLAHDIADGLSLFEMFLDNLARQIFDQALLTKAEETIDVSLKSVLAMTDKNDDVLELFDIYAKLLKSHENTILYDDSGAIEPVVGEVVHSYHLKGEGVLDDEDIEDVIIQEETQTPISDNVQVLSFSQRQVALKSAPTTLMTDREKSKGILLTDVLSLPSISLSDGMNNDNDLTVSAIKAYHASQEPPKITTTAYEIAKASLKDDDFSHDREFRTIFVEEADETIDELHAHLNAWQKNISNLTPLKEVRRNFHTLKGSGRMVGAFGVGETAWVIENMLNRVLDGTIAVSNDVAKLVSEVTDIMPIMVQNFANSQPPSVDNALIVLKANNILKERPLNDGVPVGASLYPVHMDKAEPVSEPVSAINSIANAQQQNTSKSIIIEIPSVLQRFVEKASQPLISIFGEVDDDIKEIFVEEAQEVLDDAIPTFKLWLSDREKRELLVEVRRHFHTLKGSGRMVGAMELGELAWAMENMLNRVLDDTIAINEGMCTLVSEVLGEFDCLVKIFDDGTEKYPDLMILWTASANAYAKGLGNEFDYRTLSQKSVYIEPDWSAQMSDKTTLDLKQEPLAEIQTSSDTTDDVDSGVMASQMATISQDNQQTEHDEPTQPIPKNHAVNALASIKQAGELIQNIKPITPHDAEEEMLGQIFVEEGRELLADVQEFLNAHQEEQSVPVSDKVVRAFHTLRGASGLPSLKDVGDVGAMIERVLQDLQQHEQPMNQTHLCALDNAVTLIQERLTAYENADSMDNEHFQEDKHVLETMLPKEQEKLPSISELIAGIDELLDADVSLQAVCVQSYDDVKNHADTLLAQIRLLSERTKKRPKFQRLLAPMQGAYELIQVYPLSVKDDTFVKVLLSAHEMLVGLFDAIAGSMSLKVDEVVLSALQDNTIRLTVDYHRQRHLQEISHAQNAIVTVFNKPQTEDELYFEPIRTDDELLQIFLDEALQLDDITQKTLMAWRDDLNNTKHLQSLRRHLHTIKGGAKLAGIISIDELAGESELLLDKLKSGELTVSLGWFGVVGQLFDVLSLQFEMIKSAKQSFFAERTIAELKNVLLSGQVADDATIYTPKIELDEVFDEAFEVSENQAQSVSDFDETMSFDKLIEDSWQGVMPDEDILAVFLEEASELAESSAEDFALFKSNTGDVEALQSLQRKLHTIKGGARMVSANGMADLAHEMETIYEDLGNRRRPATKMVTQLLFACHDWITSAVGLLENRYNPPRPLAYIDALRGFTQDPDSLTAVPQISLEQDILTVNHYKQLANELSDVRSIEQMPPAKGVFGEQTETSASAEMIRISALLMERMINLSGEAAINRARIDMNMVSLTASIEEMGATAQRLADQLRRMDSELEEQILAQLDTDELDAGFDPLEMDQYSSLNQLSKSLSESASDLLDIKMTLLEKTRDSENLLLQLSRTQAQLQDSLMSSRMVPFSRLTPRLQRIVRQTAGELGKSVELTVINADDEMDRNILDHIVSPLEHMLRNAVDHGIESPDYRSEIGKPATGYIVLEVRREGDEIVISLSDDGAGVNVDAVRKKAISQGLIQATDQLADNDIMQYIFNSGLSTTNKITQISGRGVGMDVVRSEIRQLGGSVSVESERGQGSRFVIRVPLTVAMSDALVVRVADRQYAVPLIQIDRVIQVDTQTVMSFYESSANVLKIEGVAYRLRYLDEILNNNSFEPINAESSVPVIIIKNRVGQLLALQVDDIVGSRTEVVVKPLGRQLSHLSGISAATIMGDGSVMLILDLLALMRVPQSHMIKPNKAKSTQRDLVMVVDDSVTVRKVTSRFLERHGFDVLVAKDGVDAIEKLQDAVPDLMLLDIEMPRMDGFEVATQVRNSPRLKELPIIMITSRTGEKHRQRAFEIGVTDYMGKPYQESDLLSRIYEILDKRENR